MFSFSCVWAVSLARSLKCVGRMCISVTDVPPKGSTSAAEQLFECTSLSTCVSSRIVSDAGRHFYFFFRRHSRVGLIGGVSEFVSGSMMFIDTPGPGYPRWQFLCGAGCRVWAHCGIEPLARSCPSLTPSQLEGKGPCRGSS